MTAPLIIPASWNPWVDWGVRLWGRVAPTDYSDPYPQTLDILMQGWFQVHQTLSSRNGIIAARRKRGMEVFVYADKNTYRLCDTTMWGHSDTLTDNLNWIPVSANANTLVFPVTNVSTYQIMHNMNKFVEVVCIDAYGKYCGCWLTRVNDNEVDANFLTPFTGMIVVI